jgi:hypothetical protein
VRRPASFSVVVLGAYVALATAAFCTAWRAPTERWIGRDFDPVLFIWHLRWLPFALAHGHDPLVSNYLVYPDGFNLMWNTSILLPALVLSPVTLLFGAVLSYNILSTLALALSGWCAYLAFRRYVRREAAAVGGLLYGFSPFMFAQAANHPHLTFAAFPPLALLLLDEIVVRQRRSAVAMGLVLGVAAALQLLTGEEILAATVLVAAIALALLALLHRDEVRPRVAHAAKALGFAAVAALLIAAVPLGVQLFGAERVSAASGPIQPKGTFVVDALEFLVPTPRQELTFDAADRVGRRFSGPSEIDGYIGIPLLILAAFVVVRYRSERLVRFAAGLAVLVALLSLGPRPHVAGHSLPIPLPWVIPQRLPLFENILPTRLALFTFLLLALLVAFFADRSRMPRVVVAAILAAALVPLIPNLPYPSTAAASPSFFESGAHQIPEGSVALIAPLAGVAGGTTRPMLWQVAADLRFRMPEGYVIRPHGNFDLPDTYPALFDRMAQLGTGEPAPPLTQADRAEISCALLRLHVRTVVIGPMKVGHHETYDLFREVLGDYPIGVGGVELWPDPDVLLAARRGARGCT